MPSENPDYYRILGVPEDATFAEIRAAFRERAREYHPDRNPDPNADDHMRKINEAYEALRAAAPHDRAESEEDEGDDDDEWERAYDRSFHAPHIAIPAVGEVAFRLGQNYASGVRDELAALGLGSKNTPNGLWHIMYEAAIESARELGGPEAAQKAARMAAWNSARNESTRQAARHPPRERMVSKAEVLAEDIAIDVTGYVALRTGHRSAAGRVPGSPGEEAWRSVYYGVYVTARRRLLEELGWDLTRGARDIDQVMKPFMKEARKVGFAKLKYLWYLPPKQRRDWDQPRYG